MYCCLKSDSTSLVPTFSAFSDSLASYRWHGLWKTLPDDNLVLCLSSLQNFWSASLSINLFLAECKAFRCNAINLLAITPFNPGGLFASLMGNLDCSQIPTDWGYADRSLITSFYILYTRQGQIQDYILCRTSLFPSCSQELCFAFQQCCWNMEILLQ